MHITGNGFYPPFFKNKSGFAKKFLPPKALQIIEKYMKKGGPGAKLEMDSFGGKMRKIPSDANAFVHRDDTLYWVQLQCHWSRQPEVEKYLPWVLEFFGKLDKYLSGAYVNCPDSDLEHPLEDYYGSNLPRLRQIKAKYDPHNVFRYPQSIRAK
jgi:FAD/FMN-containing dehydrogenase